MGRQLNQIIEGLSGVTAGTSTINVNLDAIEALLTTLQADVADGIIVSSGTANTNLRDGAGNAITSSTRGSQRPLSVQILDSSGNQITSFGTSDVNAKLQDGSGNAITSTLDGSKRRLDVMLSSGGATGSAAPTNANLVGGTDGTNLRGIRTDTSGRVSTQIFDSSGTALTYAGTGTAGTPSSDVVTVQGVGGMTALTVAQTTASSLNATVVQSTATNLRSQAECYQGGSAVSTTNPLQVTLANTASNSTAVNIAPRNGAVTVTAGTTSGTANTSAQALASSSTRRYLLIQNISDTDMYFNFGAAATTSHLLLKSGGAGITFETGFVPTDAVNVICSAASKSYYILSA